MAFQRTRGGFLPWRRRRTAAITIRAGQFGRLTTTTLGGGSDSACCVSKTRMPAMNVPASPPRSGWCARMNCLRRRSVSFIQPSPASPPPHRIALRRKAVTAPQSRSCPAVTIPRRPGFPDGSTTGLPSGRQERLASLGGRRLSLISILLAMRADFVRRGLAPGRGSPPSLTGTGFGARWTRPRQSEIAPPLEAIPAASR
jgi:hypothetical protein